MAPLADGRAGKKKALCVALCYQSLEQRYHLTSTYRDVDRIHDLLVGMFIVVLPSTLFEMNVRSLPVSLEGYHDPQR